MKLILKAPTQLRNFIIKFTFWPVVQTKFTSVSEVYVNIKMKSIKQYFIVVVI